MAKRRRRLFSAAESAEVWDRWQRGEGLKLIGRVLGRSSSTIFAHLKPHGGIRPVPRPRSRWVLSLDDREEISRGVAAGVSLRSIAAQLRRAPSTISRELRRNGGHCFLSCGCRGPAGVALRATTQAVQAGTA
jgi:DNA-binding CsgD family transcriptional regulator